MQIPPPAFKLLKDKMYLLGEIDCDEFDGDRQISLIELKNLIAILQEKYGENAKLRFDAGYNNVIVRIQPRTSDG